MDKYNTKTTINKWFSFIKTENLSLMARQSIHQFDAYTKKLTFERVLKLFLFAINNETESLRHLDQQLVDPKLKKAVGVNRISYSQLSRALKVIDNEVLLEIFYQLLSLVRQKTAGHSNKRVYLIDSTTFSFSQPSYPWAQFRQTKSGVKLHLSVCFMEDGTLHPEQFEISNAVEHDHDFLDVLVNKPLATYVFDRGYLDFERFDQLHWDGYFFVTRVKKNTIVHVLDAFDTSESSDVISDQLVALGKQNYLTSRFRLVTIRRKGRSDLRIVTNRHDLPAEEIGKMYQSRWQIELFFKHIKQHMTIKTFFSKSENGVANQLCLAMIVYLLTLLIKLELSLKHTSFHILRRLRSVQFEPYAYFKKLFEPD